MYLHQNKNVLFEEELNLWSQQLANISITYINTKDMGEANENLLVDMGVQVRNIRIDSFGGY